MAKRWTDINTCGRKGVSQTGGPFCEEEELCRLGSISLRRERLFYPPNAAFRTSSPLGQNLLDLSLRLGENRSSAFKQVRIKTTQGLLVDT